MKWLDDVPWSEVKADAGFQSSGLTPHNVIGAHAKCRPLLRLLRLLGHDVPAFWYGDRDADRWVKLDLAAHKLITDAPPPSWASSGTNIHIETRAVLHARDATVSFAIPSSLANATFGGSIDAIDSAVEAEIGRGIPLLVNAVKLARSGDALVARAGTGLTWLFDPKNWLAADSPDRALLGEHWDGLASVGDKVRSLHLAGLDDVAASFFEEQVRSRRIARPALFRPNAPASFSYELDKEYLDGHNLFDGILKVQQIRGRLTVLEGDREAFNATLFDAMMMMRDSAVSNPPPMPKPFECITDCRSFGQFVTRTLRNDMGEDERFTAIATTLRWFVREAPVHWTGDPAAAPRSLTPGEKMWGAAYALLQEWWIGHTDTGGFLERFFPALLAALTDEDPKLPPPPPEVYATPLSPSTPLVADVSLNPCAICAASPATDDANPYVRPAMEGSFSVPTLSFLQAASTSFLPVWASPAAAVVSGFVTAIEDVVSDEAASMQSFHQLIDKLEAQKEIIGKLLGPFGALVYTTQLSGFRYNVAFVKGICSGLWTAVNTPEKRAQNEALVSSAMQVNLCGLVIQPVSFLAFILGGLKQMFCDLCDLVTGLVALFDNAGLIADKVLEVGRLAEQAFTALVQAAFETTADQAWSGMVKAREAIQAITGEIKEEDIAGVIEELGAYLGEMLVTEPLKFLFGEAAAFDLRNKSFTENLMTVWWYFFGWGKFIGPLVIEIIVTAVTGVGVVELIGKNSLKLLARLAPRVFKMVETFVKRAIGAVLRYADDIFEFIKSKSSAILGYLNIAIPDSVTDGFASAFDLLKQLVGPADLVELLLEALAAVGTLVRDAAAAGDVEVVTP